MELGSAASYAESKKLADAQKPALDKLLAAQGMKLLYAAGGIRTTVVAEAMQQLG